MGSTEDLFIEHKCSNSSKLIASLTILGTVLKVPASILLVFHENLRFQWVNEKCLSLTGIEKYYKTFPGSKKPVNNPSLLPQLTDERERTTDQRSHPWFSCQP